jgi:hypothetical protein
VAVDEFDRMEGITCIDEECAPDSGEEAENEENEALERGTYLGGARPKQLAIIGFPFPTSVLTAGRKNACFTTERIITSTKMPWFQMLGASRISQKAKFYCCSIQKTNIRSFMIKIVNRSTITFLRGASLAPAWGAVMKSQESQDGTHRYTRQKPAELSKHCVCVCMRVIVLLCLYVHEFMYAM